MYLGIDLGTSGVKSLVIDDDHQVVALAQANLEVQRPADGWSEQRPDDWIEATSKTFAELQVKFPDIVRSVRGIGLSGQQHGATLIDAADKPLRPCILWNDGRSAEQAARLNQPDLQQLAGSIIFAGFTAPKLLWVTEHEPDIREQVAKVLLPKDYLRLWLTGEHVSEMSDASGTGWMDIAKRQWSPALLKAGGMLEDQMPSLVEGSEVSGQLRSELVKQFGFADSVVVAGGAGDNAASACGMGTISEGSAFVSLGTSGVVFASNSSYRPKPESAVHTFCHAVPSTWHQMGVILSATDALNWFSTITGQSAADLTTELEQSSETPLRPPGGVTFLPYLSGERTPHNDAAIRGGFSGIGHATDRSAMTQAVLEGVTFAVRDNIAALEQAGTSLDRMMAVGGGTRSSYWLNLIATATGIPVDVAVDGDFGAGFGAARLGMLAATGADPVSVCTKPAVEKSFMPDPQLKGAFDDAYERYRKAYLAMCELR